MKSKNIELYCQIYIVNRMKFLLTFVSLFVFILNFSQIEGKWKTIDDETGKPKSVIEISKDSSGKYVGKISKLLIKPSNPNCTKCKDDRKDKPLIGLEIIRGLIKNGDHFTGGIITNPSDGKSYKTAMVREGNELKVKALIMGIAVKTQTWQKIE